MLKLTPPDT